MKVKRKFTDFQVFSIYHNINHLPTYPTNLSLHAADAV